MTEPTVCVVGSSEAALSASTREWLDRQPTAGTENDVIMRASLGMDRADVPLKRAEAEQRAARAEARLAELQAELAEERRTQARSSRRASDAVDGWAADRRRRRR